MNIKKYCARSVEEALALLKRELGEDAVILSTRESAFGGCEIVAARDEPRPAALGAASPDDSPGRPRRPAWAPRAEAAGSQRPPRPELARARPLPRPAAHGPRMIRRGPPGRMSERPLEPSIGIAEQLRDRNVDDTLARALARAAVEGPGGAQVRLARLIRTVFQADTEPPASALALVGPTGVGKTTTLAKLAAGSLLRGPVAILTCDTFRIAAVEQLAILAGLIDVPFRVAYTPEELSNAAQEMRREGFQVLVDTPGRSPRDVDGLNMLQAFLKSVPGCQKHLVVPATLHGRDLEGLWERFSRLDLDRLILSKLDEGTTYGSCLTLAAKARRPVSFVTFGQNVPLDVAEAKSLDLAELVLKGSLNAPSSQKTA